MKRSRDEFDNDSGSEQASLTESSAAPVKIVHIEEAALPGPVIRCSLHQPELSFSTFEEYESHYNQSHMWRCSECRHNFPSEHYLGIHIEEYHDSLTQVRKERGERIYACFVEGCDRKCSTPAKRQSHLIDKHLFPKDFDFHIIRNGIDGRSSLLKSGRPQWHNQKQQRKAKAKAAEKLIGPTQPKEEEVDSVQEDKMDEDQTPTSSALPPPSVQSPDAEMTGLASAMSSLKFIPTSVRFGRGGGRGKGRGGMSKH